MKVYFLLLSLLGPIEAVAQKQQGPAKVTLLMVVARSFGEEQVFTVTNDSVSVIKRTSSEDNNHESRYARALTGQERGNLLSSFNNIYLSQLNSSYESADAPTDGTTLTLYIEKGKTVKSIKIYMYKLTPFYTFSNKLNRLLPPAFRLDYNDSYFSNY